MNFELLRKKTAQTFFLEEDINISVPLKIGIFDLTYDIDSEDLIKKITEFKTKYPKSMHEYAKNSTAVRAWHSDYHTHKLTSILDDLIRLKIEKIKKFITPMYIPNLSDIWINWYNKDDYAKRHNHGMFMISTVFYPKIDGESSPLIFDNNNSSNFLEKKIFPKTGMLVCFHSLLHHKVSIHKNHSPRLSIASNFSVKLDAGNYDPFASQQDN